MKKIKLILMSTLITLLCFPSIINAENADNETIFATGLQGEKLTPDFFPKNFKQWDGGSIPFTFMRKGDKTDETVGMMSAEMLSEKLNSFK